MSQFSFQDFEDLKKKDHPRMKRLQWSWSYLTHVVQKRRQATVTVLAKGKNIGL